VNIKNSGFLELEVATKLLKALAADDTFPRIATSERLLSIMTLLELVSSEPHICFSEHGENFGTSGVQRHFRLTPSQDIACSQLLKGQAARDELVLQLRNVVEQEIKNTNLLFFIRKNIPFAAGWFPWLDLLRIAQQQKLTASCHVIITGDVMLPLDHDNPPTSKSAVRFTNQLLEILNMLVTGKTRHPEGAPTEPDEDREFELPKLSKQAQHSLCYRLPNRYSIRTIRDLREAVANGLTIKILDDVRLVTLDAAKYVAAEAAKLGITIPVR
jgi:hypothetical protein